MSTQEISDGILAALLQMEAAERREQAAKRAAAATRAAPICAEHGPKRLYVSPRGGRKWLCAECNRAESLRRYHASTVTRRGHAKEAS